MPPALALESMSSASPASGELAILPASSLDHVPPHWQLLARVGEGSTSVVWHARHAETGQCAALKLARHEPGAYAALAREALLLARVARRWGPSLVGAGPGFVATEWLEGEPLAPLAIPRAEGDANRLAATVAHAVGRALEELHEAGVRHGDVKPANVVRLSRTPQRDAADD